MKKNEYVAPEMEIVEITEQCKLLAGSGDDPLIPENPSGGEGGTPGDGDW